MGGGGRRFGAETVETFLAPLSGRFVPGLRWAGAFDRFCGIFYFFSSFFYFGKILSSQKKFSKTNPWR